MTYLILGLGGATTLLGFLLLCAYSAIGKLKKQVEVERNIAEDYKYRAKELRERIRSNEEIDKEPMSTSIGDALDGMPNR